MGIKPQLFCFTYAGGNAAFFDEIEKDLDDFNLIKPDYAGHGIRHREEYYKDFEELGDDMFHQVKKQLSAPYALFGYSMGSIALVEVLQRIIKNQIVLPQHVFLAAHEPYTKSELLGFSSDELDEWVKNRTIQFGAVPEKLLNNNVYWRTYLPLYRADYTILGKYEFEKLDLCTDVPTTVFYSESDTPLSDMKLWKRFFVGQIEFKSYEGTHFFIQKHHSEMAKIIKGRLGV